MNDGKRCPSCDTWKPREEYHRCQQNVHGMSTYCRACKKAKAQDYRARHPEEERQRAVYFRTQGTGSKPEYRQARYQANREKLIRRVTEYQRRNPEIRERAVMAAKARRKQHIEAGDVTSLQLRDLVARYGGCCHYCGKPVPNIKPYPNSPVGFDHVVPFAKGGRHTISNLVPCCGPCNTAKSINDAKGV